MLMSLASAQQTAWEVEKSRTTWAFDVRWKDGQGERHRARFELPAKDVKADLDEPLRMKPTDAHKAVAKDINAWAEDQKGVSIKARGTKKGVKISGSSKQGRKKLKTAMREASEVRDEAFDDWMDDNGFTELKRGVVPDHASHASNYADDVEPIVEALGGPTADPRAFAELALSFVQSIPYEKASLKRDRYRRPLSLVGRNKGDCDSKATLYLALMRGAYPELPLTVLYIKGHAFVGVGLEPAKGDTTLRQDGTVYVLAEPVGPALKPLGEVDGKSRRKAKTGRSESRAVIRG